MSLEGFPLSPFEETTAPAGNQRNGQETAYLDDRKHTEVTVKTKVYSPDGSVTLKGHAVLYKHFLSAEEM